MAAPLLQDLETLSKFDGRTLPSWIVERRVAEILTNENDSGEPIDLNRTAGAAVQWGFSSLVGLTYFLIALPIVGTYIARCPSDAQSHSFATYPEGLLWIMFFAPLTVIVLVAQWKITTFVLVPQIQRLNKDAREMAPTTQFSLWFLLHSAFTVFNLLDQMTNALFTAKVWATRKCFGYQYIQHVWVQTMGQSVFGRLPFVDGMDFAEVAAWSYAVQLIVQTVLALCYSVPLPWGPDPEYEVRMTPGDVGKFKSLSDSKCNPADLTDNSSAAMILAEANRMEVVVANDLAYRYALVKHLVDAELHHAHDDAVYDEGLEIALGALGRGLMRFCMRGLLQNALQVNLQVSFIAISETVLNGDWDTFNAFSLVITILSMGADLPDIYNCCQFAWGMLRAVPAREGITYKRFCLGCRLCRLMFYSAAYIFMALYALVKLFKASFVCEYGVWNWQGCVVVKPLGHNVSTCPVSEYMCDL